MLRNKIAALSTLKFIQENDVTGGGIYRSELWKVFEDFVNGRRDDAWDMAEYHLHLLEGAGFIKRTANEGDRALDDFELTWAGHDYLDNN